MPQLRASSYGTLRSLGETSTIIPVSIISSKLKIDLCNSDQDFKCYWRRRFAVGLQRCNAKVLIQKMNRSRSKENDFSDIFSVQLQSTYVDNFLETRVGLLDV